MGDRRTEHGHDAVADMLVDVAAMLGDQAVGELEEGVEERVDLLGVELVGQRRVADEVGEQHAHLPPLALRSVRPAVPRRGPGAQRGDRLEQPSPMTDRGDPELLQVVGRQRRQQRRVDGVVRECLGILLQPQALQPAGHVHGRNSGRLAAV